MDNIEEEFERAMLELETSTASKTKPQLSAGITTVVARGMPEQAPFQSGCTPAFQGRQCLVWNTIGQCGHSRDKPVTLFSQATDLAPFSLICLGLSPTVHAQKGSIISHDEQTFHSIEIDYSNKEAGRAVS